MTEQNSQSPNPPPPPDKKPAAKKPRKWRRRIIITAIVLLALGLLFRLVVILALPPVLRHVAAHFGLNASYENLDLYLLDGDVGIWHFKLTPVQGGNSLVQSEYARCHVSTFDLLRGKLTIHRLESEGVDMRIERLADGTIPLLQRFISQATSPNAPPSPISIQPKAPPNIDLTSPLRIDTFRLTNVHAQIHDAAVNPPLDANVDVSIRLTDLNSPERPTNLELDVTASPIMDLLHVEGTGTASGKTMDASLVVRLRGIHPRAAAGYLRPLGIVPTAHNVSMQMNAQLKMWPAAQPNSVGAKLSLDHISMIADGQEAGAVDSLELDANELGFNAAHVSQLAITGARCQAYRGPDGYLGFSGLELTGPATPTPAPIVPVAENSPVPISPTTMPTAGVPLAPLHWGLGQLVIRDCKAEFVDQAVVPPADLSAKLNALTITNISPDTPDAVTTIEGRFTVPGIIGAIRLDGKSQPFATPRTADLTLAASDICPRALRPYLDAAGLESDYSSGTFAASLHADATTNGDGSFAGNVKLFGIALKDKSELLALDSLDISGAGYEASNNKIRVKSIEISGPRLGGRREAPGVFSILGLRTKAKPAAAVVIPTAAVVDSQQVATSATASTQSDVLATIPKISVDHFAWKNVSLRFDDLAVKPPQIISTGDAGFELNDLNIDLDPSATPAKPGQFHAWLAVPKLAENISITGSVSPGATGTSINLTVDGKGITSAQIAEYFKSSRLQPVLENGSFHATAEATISRAAGGLDAELSVKDAVYKDASDEFLGVDWAQISGIRLRNGTIDVDAIDVKSPRISARREADGSFLAAGFKLMPAPPSAAPPQDDLLQPTGNHTVSATAPIATTTPSAPPAFAATLGKLSVHDASVRWEDQAVSPPAVAHLVADVDLENAVIGKSAKAATFKIVAHEDQAMDKLLIFGGFTAPPDPWAQISIVGSGIRAGSLGAYVGPDAEVNLKNGFFHATINASAHKNPTGGNRGYLEITDLDYRDLGDREPLCALDSFKLSVANVDLPSGFSRGGLIDVDQISLDGLQAAATRSADGKIRAMGLTLGVSHPVVAAAPTTRVAAPTVEIVNTTAKPLVLSDLAGMGRKKYPLIKLDNMNLNVRRISLTDLSHPSATPLALSDFYLWNLNQIALLGSDPQPGQKIEMELAGRIDPLVKTVNVHALVWPFADQPGLTVNVNCDGIRGQGVTDLLPDLKKHLDGSQLTQGRFGAHLGLRLKRDRKDPLNFDLSKGIGLDVTLKAVQFQDRPDGPVLMGLEELHSENIRVRGGGSTVIVKELDLTNPTANIYRDAAGVHVLGWIVKLPTKPIPQKAATTPTTRAKANQVAAASTSAPSPASKPATTLVAASSPPEPRHKPKSEIRIDKILLSGLDFNFEDRTCHPQLVVPLNSLDMEVRDLSTLMPYQDSACRFEVLVGAGKVKPDQRELFSQAEASGIVSLYPHPKGWVKTSLSALDLAALRGAASQAGVNLGGGTFDSSIDLRFVGDGTTETRSRFAFTDLLLTEPSNGPIRRTLKLDVPLDVAIAALQDSDGSITIPLEIPIHSTNISSSDIAGPAIGAVAQIIFTAVTNAPMKMANVALSVFGNDKSKTAAEPMQISFDPADPSLGLQDVLRLQSLVQQMHDNPNLTLTMRHQLGEGDISRVSFLANPSPEDCRNLAYRLRLKKMELLSARQIASQQVRAQLASGYGAAADDAVRHLREIDRAIGTTEDALDRVYDMLKPGADRQAARRTKAACLQIAQDRLDIVRAFLLSSQIPGLEQRIKMAHPTFSPTKGDGGGVIQIALTQTKNQ